MLVTLKSVPRSDGSVALCKRIIAASFFTVRRGGEPSDRGRVELKWPEAEASLRLALVFAVADGDHFYFAICEALFFEAELFGGSGSDVDDAAGDEGAAIVDSHFETFAVFEVGDLDHTGNREGFVGG